MLEIGGKIRSIMKKQQNSSEAGLLVHQLMEMWESGETRQLDEIAIDDIVYDDVPNGIRFEGYEGVRRYIGHVHAWAGQVKLEIKSVHGSTESAVAEWVMQGIQDRPIPGRIPVATNRNFQLKGATIVELRDGKIARAADYIDVLEFIIQLGGRVTLPGGVVLHQG